MKKLVYLLAFSLMATAVKGYACTNVIVTKGASADGSCMVSYAADSHWLYGELYSTKAGNYNPGAMLDITEWDTHRPLGQITQVAHTYRTMGNMNEHQLIIGETTWGGREEQVDTTGIMDYGSLIYITLQRARTAREAIQTIVALANEYGYPSEGETFSIADTEEAWIMDLVGKGSDDKGIVWVARRIPDGYICAHANQSRITTFPQDDPDNCLFAPDVIDYARRMGWYSGSDADFSFREAYNAPDFGGMRGCEARAWSVFNTLCDGVFCFDGQARPAGEYLNIVMGYDTKGEMPLFVKPQRKITVKDVAEVMRDHYEGTPMDMTTDIGAGGNACPYRWRPMSFQVDGRHYMNERAIATQQTGFWFVAQSRGYLPDEVGALVWFGCDDAATSYLTPIYVNSTRVPECLRPGNGDLLHYSSTSQFWICNRVTNACYRMYNYMAPVVREAADKYENYQMNEGVPAMDAKVAKLLQRKCPVRRWLAKRRLTRYTVDCAQKQFDVWTKLEEMLTVKFIDGNVKPQDQEGNFLHSKYSTGVPDKIDQPGYTQKWKEAVVRDNGAVLEMK